ncbi:DNA ligase [Paraburkholderia sp. CNPSo 3076]|uniref:ATP-dependent DNA ligase n=1 Tax=Paraburkholderia sp. CNPSo 3076 TaxID=2940936 RepID=UPI00225B7B03|nr:DNA ligase [Paraburkholderia sp. CNPSo 3076]MCX5544684.1 DNA ligase [Paraburkholderia sp. CNPSo 3076]
MIAFGADELMHASRHPRPFSDPGWLFEWKYDGFRCLVRKCGAQVELVSRQGKSFNLSFPEVAAAVAAMPGDFVWDGELATGAGRGVEAFRLLQERARLKLPKNVIVAARKNPARLFLFDMMIGGRRDLRALPMLERKVHLRDAFDDTPTLVFSSSINGAGEAVFDEVRRHGFEGMLAKRLASPYRAGRTKDWLKIKDSAYGRQGF